MARTQAADYDERREAIVEQAARLYARAGFLGCSIADLAEACGVSKSLIYHYFSSKEEILFEIMDGHVGALARVAERVAREPDAERRLVALTHGFMALYVGAAARQKVLLNDLDKLPEPRRAAIVETERGLLDAVEGIVAALSPPLARAPAERRAMTMLYFGMINWTHTWFDPAGPVDPPRLADMVVSTFLRGLPR